MKVTESDKGFYVLDGANLKQRQWLEKNLLTEVKLVGDRVFFKPTPQVMSWFEGLNNIEIDAKIPQTSSINHDYPLRYALEMFPHQAEVLPRIRKMGNFGLLWEVGLGKSKTGIDIAMERFVNRQINALLVVTLNGVHKKWITKDLPENMTIPCEAMAWPITDKKQDKLLKHNGLIVATINFDSVWRPKGVAFVKRLLTTRKVMLIVDESHEAKGYDASRTKALIQLAPLAKFRMIMTGTVVPNSPLDLWSQMQILDSNIWKGMNYFQFKHRYAVEKELPGVTYTRKLKNGTTIEVPVKTVVDYKNLEELNQIIAPYISRVDKSVLKLKDPIYLPEYFDLSEEQRRSYNEAVKLKMSEFDGKAMTVEQAMTLRIRLSQITQGFFVTDDGEVKWFKENPRLESLANTMYQIPKNKKALIWAPFRESILSIRQHLLDEYGAESFVEYWGDTPEKERIPNVERFQKDDSVRWLLGNPQAAGTGHTMTAATYALYYGNSPRLKDRLQSEGRLHRIGQEEVVTYVDYIGNGTRDMEQIRAFKDKMEMAAIIQGDTLRDWLI